MHFLSISAGVGGGGGVLCTTLRPVSIHTSVQLELSSLLLLLRAVITWTGGSEAARVEELQQQRQVAQGRQVDSVKQQHPSRLRTERWVQGWLGLISTFHHEPGSVKAYKYWSAVRLRGEGALFKRRLQQFRAVNTFALRNLREYLAATGERCFVIRYLLVDFCLKNEFAIPALNFRGPDTPFDKYTFWDTLGRSILTLSPRTDPRCGNCVILERARWKLVRTRAMRCNAVPMQCWSRPTLKMDKTNKWKSRSTFDCWTALIDGFGVPFWVLDSDWYIFRDYEREIKISGWWDRCMSIIFKLFCYLNDIA